jgi:hypothetical protein
MAKFYPSLTVPLLEFIQRQHMFFTGSAAPAGRVNVSPKGLDTFRVVDDKQVAYLDLTGSGAETAAHLRADGRLTVMFCAFEGQPLILRLYGRGRLVTPSDPSWTGLAARFPAVPGARQIVVLEIESVQTSCGFGVPEYRFKAHRQALVAWATKRGDTGLADYRKENNRASIDGLPTGLG